MDLVGWLSRLQATLRVLRQMVTEYHRYISILEGLETELTRIIHSGQSTVDTREETQCTSDGTVDQPTLLDALPESDASSQPVNSSPESSPTRRLRSSSGRPSRTSKRG